MPTRPARPRSRPSRSGSRWRAGISKGPGPCHRSTPRARAGARRHAGPRASRPARRPRPRTTPSSASTAARTRARPPVSPGSRLHHRDPYPSSARMPDRAGTTARRRRSPPRSRSGAVTSWRPPILRAVQIRTLCWNIFHGRDAPPDPSLYTLRSKLFRITERDGNYVQVNRDLFQQYADLITAAEWDVALLQEFPPRWAQPLAGRCRPEAHRVLTSRNWIPPLQGAIHRFNPDLPGSWEGGSNTTLIRKRGIADRLELVIPRGDPERRAMAFTRLDDGVCIANFHARNDNYPLAEEEVRLAAETA